MSNFNEKVLEEVAHIDDEQLNSSTDSGYSFYYIDISSVSTNQIQFPADKIQFRNAPSRARKVLKDGDILMSTVRPNLKAFAKFKKPSTANYIASTGFAILSEKKGYCLDYVYHSLFSENLEKQINSFVVGSNYPALNSGDIRNLKLLVPGYKKQVYIANVLNAVNSVITKTEQAISKYKCIKLGMLHDLFTRGIGADGKLRPTVQQAPELYKPSAFGMIPKEWDEGKLIDFADDNIHYSFTGGPFGSDLQTKHYVPFGVRIIQLQNIGDGVFNDDYKIYTTAEKADQLSSCNIFPGEIIIAKMADPVARACIIPATAKRFLMASDGIRLCVNKKRHNTRFVMETINLETFRKIAIAKSTGSTRARIGLTELRGIAVKYPKLDEQNLIAKVLHSIDAKIEYEVKALEKHVILKQGLMADLLTGKKEVTINEELVREKEMMV